MNNINKILQYLSPVAIGPVIVDGKDHTKIVKHIKFADTIFCKDDCISCGMCCLSENNVLTESEYQKALSTTEQDFIDYPLPPENLKEFLDNLVEEVHDVNGNEIKLYVYKHPGNDMYIPGKGRIIKRCKWMFKDGDLYRCGIHPIRSITCRMPHIRFFHSVRGTLSVAMSQYGRNWALGCKIELKQPENEDEFKECKDSRLFHLNYLKQVADDIKLDTHLPEIIEYLENIPYENYLQYLKKDVVDLSKSKSIF